MIFDCCRGNDASSLFNLLKKTKGTSWVDEKFHVDSGIASIFGNTTGYGVVDDIKKGGCLTGAIKPYLKILQ